MSRPSRQRTFHQRLPIWMAIGIASWLAGGCSPRVPVARVLESYREEVDYPASSLRLPLDQTVFPADIAPMPFVWRDDATSSDTWLLLFQPADGSAPLHFVALRKEWTPGPADWDKIKRLSSGKPAKLTVLGFQRSSPLKILSRARGSFVTSGDEVAAPIFYREVNLPFLEAVKDPSRIRWRFGAVSSPEPPRVVLENLPVCGNCHSFSRDGNVLGMDVDYANNKGSYVVTRVSREMSLASSDVITWDDFKPEDHLKTYGLLSQVSPDGRAVISTVKDKSVFVPKPDLAFSQLFFPIQGILAVYHPASRAFQSLPGADDPEYVQSNPSWSPDGKHILFARARTYRLRNQEAESKLLLTEEDCAEFLRDGKPFLFDIYRIPYNDGRGGEPEPLRGASHNGRSNYFPKYSPDGKWIVFCQARSYMLLQPDSELYLIPAEGGEARRLQCNIGRMNSWHSWSPNGRWLVFSSKADSPYTRLCLAHIDPTGESSPPVVLTHFTAPDRAANIPEFVNAAPDAIVKINERFLNDRSFARAAYAFEHSGDVDRAVAEYKKALRLNPRNSQAHQRLGYLLFHARRQPAEGLRHTLEALRLDPDNGCAHYDLGVILSTRGEFDSAVPHLTNAVRLLPKGFDRRYNPVDMRCSLAGALLARQEPAKAARIIEEVLVQAPRSAQAHYLMASALAVQGGADEAVRYYETARSIDAAVDVSPELHFILSANFERSGQYQTALRYAEMALELAGKRGDPDFLRAVHARLDQCRRNAGLE